VIVTIGFNREIEDAIRAMKTNQFVSADAPELDPEKVKSALVRESEGEPTWREKVIRDTQAVQEKLKLAEERLKETEDRNRAARNLAEMQKRLGSIEKKIESSETETERLVKRVNTPVVGEAAQRKPAAVRPKAAKPVNSKPEPAKREPAASSNSAPAGAPVGAPVGVSVAPAAPSFNGATVPADGANIVAPTDIPIENLGR
jgi:hypothetical protein